MRIQLPRPLAQLAVDPQPQISPIDAARQEQLAWAIHLVWAAELVYQNLPTARLWLEANGCQDVTLFDRGFTHA